MIKDIIEAIGIIIASVISGLIVGFAIIGVIKLIEKRK